MVFSIFTSMKVFSDPWVGHPALNRLGLHRRRLRAARAVTAFRRLQTVRARTTAERALLDEGYAVIEDFLAPGEFDALAGEVRADVARAEAATPLPAASRRGFGDAMRYDWGFDRFDGGTLNRYITSGPRARAFERSPEIARLSRLVTGRKPPARRGLIYQTINGDEAANPDLQRELHRDTFFAALKYWFFLDPVRPEDGPLVYVSESHRLTRARLAWEEDKAAAAVAARIAGRRGGTTGSFRIGEAELQALGLPSPVALAVPANTLIVANVFGFHRRGDAEPGTRRLALYGSVRPQPFLPFGS